jgi:hypothetical protein
MRVRMKISIAGTFHGMVEGVTVGQVVDVQPDAEAERYIKLGYAELANQGRRSEEHALADMSNEERAVLSTEIVGASSKPVPQPRAPRPPRVEPEPEVEPKPKPVYGKTNPPDEVKRRPGRPRKS